MREPHGLRALDERELAIHDHLKAELRDPLQNQPAIVFHLMNLGRSNGWSVHGKPRPYPMWPGEEEWLCDVTWLDIKPRTHQTHNQEYPTPFLACEIEWKSGKAFWKDIRKLFIVRAELKVIVTDVMQAANYAGDLYREAPTGSGNYLLIGIPKQEGAWFAKAWTR